MESNEMVIINENAKLKHQLAALMKKDVSVLGDGKVFFLQEAGQTKRAFKVKVELDYPTHFCFPAGGEAKSMITAEGYDKLNQYAGIEVFRPKSLVAQDGTEKGNPFFERDPKTGAMLSVFMRGIGIGYAPTGSLTAVDQTIYVNLQTLLIQEVQAKIKKSPTLGMLGSADQRPTEIVYFGDNGKYGHNRVINAEPTVQKISGAWHFLPLTGTLGYWVNLAHPDIQSAFDSFTQKQRFLERTTFSILKRLIISSHPAVAAKTPIVTDLVIGDYKKVTSAKAHMIVYGFKADLSSPEEKRDELQAMADRVAEGERLANMEIVKNAAVDAAEEAEISQPEIVADPSEMPPAPEPEGFESDPPPAPVKSAEAKPAVPANSSADPAKPTVISEDPLHGVKEIFKDKANSAIAQKARTEMGLKDWTAIRTDPATAAVFIQKFLAAKGVSA